MAMLLKGILVLTGTFLAYVVVILYLRYVQNKHKIAELSKLLTPQDVETVLREVSFVTKAGSYSFPWLSPIGKPDITWDDRAFELIRKHEALMRLGHNSFGSGGSALVKELAITLMALNTDMNHAIPTEERCKAMVQVSKTIKIPEENYDQVVLLLNDCMDHLDRIIKSTTEGKTDDWMKSIERNTEVVTKIREVLKTL